MLNAQKRTEIKVPNDNNKIVYKNNNIQNASFSQDKSQLRFLESTNNKSTEVNNTMILNDNNTTQIIIHQKIILLSIF